MIFLRWLCWLSSMPSLLTVYQKVVSPQTSGLWMFATIDSPSGPLMGAPLDDPLHASSIDYFTQMPMAFSFWNASHTATNATYMALYALQHQVPLTNLHWVIDQKDIFDAFIIKKGPFSSMNIWLYLPTVPDSNEVEFWLEQGAIDGVWFSNKHNNITYGDKSYWVQCVEEQTPPTDLPAKIGHRFH